MRSCFQLNSFSSSIESGASTNRTVYTIVGKPDNVIESIISAAKVAFELIDMRKHRGEHKRLGALDVCNFLYTLSIYT